MHFPFSLSTITFSFFLLQTLSRYQYRQIVRQEQQELSVKTCPFLTFHLSVFRVKWRSPLYQYQCIFIFFTLGIRQNSKHRRRVRNVVSINHINSRTKLKVELFHILPLAYNSLMTLYTDQVDNNQYKSLLQKKCY